MQRQLKILTQGEIKTLNIDAFFDYLKSTEGKGNEVGVFKALGYIYRAVLLRASAITEVPWQVLDVRTKCDVEFPLPMTQLFYLLECDLCVHGAAYVLKQAKSVPGKPIPMLSGLRRLNPSAMKVEGDENGIKLFKWSAGKSKKDFNPREIVYLRYYDPSQDLQPGISPTKVALEAANLGVNSNKFAAAFFEHGAIPAVVLEIEGTMADAEVKETRETWQRLFGGIANKFRTALLQRGTKAHVIGSPVKDVAMPELMGEVRKQIASAFGIPEDMFTAEAANYATALSHRRSYFQDTIIPEVRLIEDAFNEQLFKEMGGILKFSVESVPVMMEEEKERAEALHSLVKSGVPLETALAILGFDVPEGMDIGPTALPLMVTGRQAQEYKNDLKLWQKKALRHLDEDDDAFCFFHSDVIPWEDQVDIWDGLGKAKTAEDVKKVFEDAV